MAVLAVALLDAAVLWWLWPQPDRLVLLGAWTLAVGNCVVAPYLAAGVAAWRWRRALADPRATCPVRKRHPTLGCGSRGLQ